MGKIKLACECTVWMIWQKGSFGKEREPGLFRDTDGRVTAFIPLIFSFQREYSKLFATTNPPLLTSHLKLLTSKTQNSVLKLAIPRIL